MIDWSLVAKIAGGGFGVTILILAILCLIIWLIGLLMQKRASKSSDKRPS
jgi:Na+-transporting methylmalonyl-CoA/oxaloacetate decarboxylase gamma subunit